MGDLIQRHCFELREYFSHGRFGVDSFRADDAESFHALSRALFRKKKIGKERSCKTTEKATTAAIDLP